MAEIAFVWQAALRRLSRGLPTGNEQGTAVIPDGGDQRRTRPQSVLKPVAARDVILPESRQPQHQRITGVWDVRGEEAIPRIRPTTNNHLTKTNTVGR